MDILSHGLWAAAAAKAYNLACTGRRSATPVYGRTTVRPYKLNTWFTAWWGVFPDLFAFTIPFAWLILGPLFGDQVPRLDPPDSGEPPLTDSHWVFHLASTLYNYSHSLIISSLLFAAVWLFQMYRLRERRLAVGKPSAARASMVPPIASGDRAGEAERVPTLVGTTRVSHTDNLSDAERPRRFPYELLGWLLHILIDIPTHSYSFYPTPFLWPISQYKFDGISWGTPWFMIVNYSSLAISYLVLWWKGKRTKRDNSLNLPTSAT